MARISSISANGDVRLCNMVEFEKSPLWTRLLGPIPSRVQEADGEEEASPESEYILQRLIELYPEVLPWHEFHDSPNADEVRVCVVCKKVKSAATDMLLIERTAGGKGRFVIAETKLVKNAEIYRAVLGQILEYAAELSSEETMERLEENARNYWNNGRGKGKVEFQRKMQEVFKRDDWREVIWESALESARRRDIRLLIVSDSLPEELRLAVTYLPTSVLLTAIELQAHDGASEHQPLVFTGIASASGTAPTAIQSAVREYFSQIRLSHAVVQSVKGGPIVGQALDRGKAGAAKPSRPYIDHLEKLGGSETVPGQMLEMLRERTLHTNGFVDEGQKSLTFRLWDLAGLFAAEEDAELWIAFYANAVSRQRKDEARRLFLKHFDPKEMKDFYKTANYSFSFQSIKHDTPLDEARRLIQRLEAVYEELRALK